MRKEHTTALAALCVPEGWMTASIALAKGCIRQLDQMPLTRRRPGLTRLIAGFY